MKEFQIDTNEFLKSQEVQAFHHVPYYTQTVNIIEDAIQALFDKGARSVIFYAIGYTV